MARTARRQPEPAWDKSAASLPHSRRLGGFHRDPLLQLKMTTGDGRGIGGLVPRGGRRGRPVEGGGLVLDRVGGGQWSKETLAGMAWERDPAAAVARGGLEPARTQTMEWGDGMAARPAAPTGPVRGKRNPQRWSWAAIPNS